MSDDLLAKYGKQLNWALESSDHEYWVYGLIGGVKKAFRRGDVYMALSFDLAHRIIIKPHNIGSFKKKIVNMEAGAPSHIRALNAPYFYAIENNNMTYG